MRTLISFLCCCVIALGVIWILQGLNILPGSYMTGQISWTVRGVGAMVAGSVILLMINGNRR
jgi:hypothetical protein